MYAVESEEDLVCSEPILAMLHEELANLSEQHRQSVILHHMQGLSYAEAASRCVCTPKAFSARLVGVREKLRKRVIKRGVNFAGAGLAAALQQCATAAEYPADLAALTCKAARLIVAGKDVQGVLSVKVAAWVDSAAKMLF